MKRPWFLCLTILFVLAAYTRGSASVRLDAFGEGVHYLQTLPEQWDAGGVTIMAWVYMVDSRGGADAAVLAIRGAGTCILAKPSIFRVNGGLRQI